MDEILNILITGILRGGMYALMAVGLSLVFGVMNIPNFAHGEFYMLGAYFAFLLFSIVQNAVVAIVVAAILAFAVGGIIEKVFFYPLRKRNDACHGVGARERNQPHQYLVNGEYIQQ